MEQPVYLPFLRLFGCTGTGETQLVRDWCARRPLYAVTGAGATALFGEAAEEAASCAPLCRWGDGRLPHATVGWLFDTCCVARLTAHSAQTTDVLDTTSCLPVSLCAELAARTTRCAAWETQAQSFLRAAAALIRQTEARVLPSLDTDRIARYAARIVARERDERGDGVFRCFLSAITPHGHEIDYTPLLALCPRIYVVEDDTSVVGHRLMHALYRRIAVSQQTCLAGLCPVTGEIDHLLLPHSGVAFTLSHPFHKVDFPVYQRIHCGRFLRSNATVPHRKQQLSLCLHGTKALLEEAVRALHAAYTLSEQNERAAAEALNRAAVNRWFSAHTDIPFLPFPT